MKKVIYIVVLAFAVMGMVSCDKNQSSSDSKPSADFSLGGKVQNNPKASAEDKAFSKVYGEGLGKSFAYSFAKNPNEKYDVDALIKGFAYILAYDSTKVSDESYLFGVHFAEQAATVIANIERMYNIHVDKEAFVAAVEEALKGPKPTQEEIDEINKKLDEAFAGYQMGGPSGMGGQQPRQMPQQQQQGQSQGNQSVPQIPLK